MGRGCLGVMFVLLLQRKQLLQEYLKKKKIERGRHIGVHLTAWFPVLPEDDQSISALLFSTHGMSTRSPERNRVVSPPLLTPRYPEPVIPGAIFWLSGDGSY